MSWKYISYLIILLLSGLNFIFVRRIHSEQDNSNKLTNNIELLSKKTQNEKHINKSLKNNILTSICNFSWEIDPNLLVYDFNKRKKTMKNNFDFKKVFLQSAMKWHTNRFTFNAKTDK